MIWSIFAVASYLLISFGLISLLYCPFFFYDLNSFLCCALILHGFSFFLLWLAFFFSLDRSVFLFISLLWIDVTGIFLLIWFSLPFLGSVELVRFDLLWFI